MVKADLEAFEAELEHVKSHSTVEWSQELKSAYEKLSEEKLDEFLLAARKSMVSGAKLTEGEVTAARARADQAGVFAKSTLAAVEKAREDRDELEKKLGDA